MHWSQFQLCADRLSQGTIEGEWRSAISRAYYAVFHYFREFFLTHKLNLGRGSQSHFNLYVGLNNCGFPAMTAIATRLDGLRKNRTWADYDLGNPISRALARTNLQTGRDIVADFQSLIQTLPPTQVVAGARQHLQAIGKLGKQP